MLPESKRLRGVGGSSRSQVRRDAGHVLVNLVDGSLGSRVPAGRDLGLEGRDVGGESAEVGNCGGDRAFQRGYVGGEFGSVESHFVYLLVESCELVGLPCDSTGEPGQERVEFGVVGLGEPVHDGEKLFYFPAGYKCPFKAAVRQSLARREAEAHQAHRGARVRDLPCTSGAG